jgi:hypothetical protein
VVLSEGDFVGFIREKCKAAVRRGYACAGAQVVVKMLITKTGLRPLPVQVKAKTTTLLSFFSVCPLPVGEGRGEGTSPQRT